MYVLPFEKRMFQISFSLCKALIKENPKISCFSQIGAKEAYLSWGFPWHGVNSFSLRYHALIWNYYMVSFPLRFRPNLEVCSCLHVVPCAYRSLNQFTIFSFHASLQRKLEISFCFFFFLQLASSYRPLCFIYLV